jgi:hypothetical protein
MKYFEKHILSGLCLRATKEDSINHSFFILLWSSARIENFYVLIQKTLKYLK